MLTLAFYLLCGIRPLVLNYWGSFVLQGIYGNIWRHFGFQSLGNGGSTSMWCVESGVLLNILQQKGQPAAETCCLVPWVVSSSLWLHGLYPARLFCPWDFPNKNTGVGCRFLLQGIFLTQGSNPGLQHCRQTLYRLSHQGSLSSYILYLIFHP